MPCIRCGRVQTDPVKGAAPWARAVMEGEQVLLCPACQQADPDWTRRIDRCPACGSTRLSVVMGSCVCRSCGNDWPARDAAGGSAPEAAP